MTKSLYDISLQISEEDYRKDTALSYSTISRFDREGFEKLNTLFDSISTSSLTFGSAVDCWITDGVEAFTERFTVGDLPEIQPAVKSIVEHLFHAFSEFYPSLKDIPSENIVDAINIANWQPRWGMTTRVERIIEQGEALYEFLQQADGKEILSLQTYQDVERCVFALKNSEATKFYFGENNDSDHIERLYQLKFKTTRKDVDYRCMMDLVIVDHRNKVIIPVDLKTSSHKEWDFPKSFVKWNYHMQARLYYRILLDNIKNDDYFKDFTILNYRFVVVNKESVYPLVWEFPYTAKEGDIQFGINSAYVMHDPELVGQTLKKYLDETPKVPYGIISKGTNDIVDWLQDYNG